MYLADTLSQPQPALLPRYQVPTTCLKWCLLVLFQQPGSGELRVHTARDQVFQTLHNVQPFYPDRDELVAEAVIVVKGHRPVIPNSLQQQYIKIMHRGHPGLESTKCRARSMVFWPNMNKDITKELLPCAECNSTHPHQLRNQHRTRPLSYPTMVYSRHWHFRMTWPIVCSTSRNILRVVWGSSSLWHFFRYCNQKTKTTHFCSWRGAPLCF